MLKLFLQIGALVFVAELVRPIGDEVFRRWGKAQYSSSGFSGFSRACIQFGNRG